MVGSNRSDFHLYRVQIFQNVAKNIPTTNALPNNVSGVFVQQQQQQQQQQYSNWRFPATIHPAI
jgi:hypothetical protein